MVAQVLVRATMAALYLPGSPYGITRPSGWARVSRAVVDTKDPHQALMHHGLVDEANALTSAALDWGIEQVTEDRVLTVFDDLYPAGWTHLLRNSAPPAVWRCGTIPGGPWVTIVGSRGLTEDQLALARSVGAAVVADGWGVVSGGARGTDRAAVDGARNQGSGARTLEILPTGIDEARAGIPSLSANPIESGFRGTQAMYRNRLLYAWSGRAVVVAVRQGEGGTWHGAVAAVRDGLAHLFVRRDGSDGAEALIQRGARAWESEAELISALREPVSERQPPLFTDSSPGRKGAGRLQVRSKPFPSSTPE
ncbi:MAG: DNA-processing protein DprA [Fimbriimonadaceae bacterium]|nr:DNA-processing protein DprA [Fimbriimonadaceae bacterium]